MTTTLDDCPGLEEIEELGNTLVDLIAGANEELAYAWLSSVEHALQEAKPEQAASRRVLTHVSITLTRRLGTRPPLH